MEIRPSSLLWGKTSERQLKGVSLGRCSGLGLSLRIKTHPVVLDGRALHRVLHAPSHFLVGPMVSLASLL